MSVYSSNNDIEDIAAAFKAKYGIDIKTYRANSETVLQRILQEDKANFHGADILENNTPEMNIASSHDLFYPYRSALRDTVRPQGVKESWTADRFNAFVVGWNTELVKPGEEPEKLRGPRFAALEGQAGDGGQRGGLVRVAEHLLAQATVRRRRRSTNSSTRSPPTPRSPRGTRRPANFSAPASTACSSPRIRRTSIPPAAQGCPRRMASG